MHIRYISLVLIPILFSFSNSHILNSCGRNHIQIMTYNVRNARGMDEKVDYDRVAAVIRANAPAVVALQELDSAAKRSNGLNVLKEIADRSGYNWVYGAAIPFEGGKYGVGVLSKEKPIGATNVPLPGNEERRNLQVVEFNNYFLFCVHLSLTAEDRMSSVQIIASEAKRKKKPVFLAGDFNAGPTSEEIQYLQKNDWHLLSGTKPTFPASKPDVCIDYIFSYGKKVPKVIKAEVINDTIASDHRPVIIEIAG